MQGFNITHNATRLIAMTKPIYNAIARHSPQNPVIIFVPTRKQAKLTAFDILTLASADRKPDRFKRVDREDLKVVESFLKQISDKVRLYSQLM